MTRDELVRVVPEAAARRASPREGKTALLVVDMQEYFRPLAAGILARIRKLVDSRRSRGIPVVFTQHGHEDPARDGGILGEWWGELIVRGTPQWEIVPELCPAPGEKVVRKRRYSAFHETDLEEHLRGEGIEDLIICGVVTNLCCETTARDAFVRDFRVFFVADGTATESEEHHRATLRNLAYGFAYVVVCDEIV